MQLLVVRHGETEFNRAGRYLGALDPALTLEGVAQAGLLRDELANRLDVVFCSPLRRAKQTAEIICWGTSLESTELPWLRERNVGVFEGLTPGEAKERFAELWERNITRQWAAAPLGGETIEQVVARVREGLAKLYSAHVGSRCVLVCHGFVAKVVRALCGAGFEDFFEWQLPNGGVLNVMANRSFDTDAQVRPLPSVAPGLCAGQVQR